MSERVDLSSPPTPNNIVRLKTSPDSAHQRKKIHKPPFVAAKKAWHYYDDRVFVVFVSCTVVSTHVSYARCQDALRTTCTHLRTYDTCAHGHDGTHDVLPRNGAKGEGGGGGGGIISK